MSEMGFIVVHDGDALHLSNYDDGPRGGLLLSNDTCTLFKDRRAAKRAIARSIAYSNRYGYKWAEKPYRIFRASR